MRGPSKRNAGSDYNFVPFEKSIKSKEIKNNMCIISDNTGDYINEFKFNLTCWGKIIDKGRYLIFKGGKTEGEKQGGAFIGGIAGAAMASGRYLYAYDTVKKEVIRFNKKNARMLLASHPDLLKKYNDSKKKNERSLDVFLEYLVELNDRS